MKTKNVSSIITRKIQYHISWSWYQIYSDIKSHLFLLLLPTCLTHPHQRCLMSFDANHSLPAALVNICPSYEGNSSSVLVYMAENWFFKMTLPLISGPARTALRNGQHIYHPPSKQAIRTITIPSDLKMESINKYSRPLMQMQWPSFKNKRLSSMT